MESKPDVLESDVSDIQNVHFRFREKPGGGEAAHKWHVRQQQIQHMPNVHFAGPPCDGDWTI